MAHVIINRAEKGGWWGSTISEVVRKPYQFSCWNDNDPNSEVCRDIADDGAEGFTSWLEDKTFRECLHAALAAITGQHPDQTGNAFHYHVSNMRNPPKWSKGVTPSAEIGHHVFFNNI